MTRRTDYRQEQKPFKPAHYIRDVVCPACEDAFLNAQPAGHGNSQSRYADATICSACGAEEAFRGFFWRTNCLKRGFPLNEAGQAEHYKATGKEL